MTEVFITLEGIEGVGKSSQVEFVAQFLRTRAHDVVVTREPGGTALGEAIRKLLLSGRPEDIDPVTELLLIFAARAAHLQEIIRPALAAGKTVVCDRFTDASYAYQGGGRGVAAEKIAQLEQLVQAELRPDLTLWLDAPVEIALARTVQRAGAPDRFESEQTAFFARVRAVYAERADREPQRCQRIDASRKLSDVSSQIENALKVFMAASTT